MSVCISFFVHLVYKSHPKICVRISAVTAIYTLGNTVKKRKAPGPGGTVAEHLQKGDRV